MHVRASSCNSAFPREETVATVCWPVCTAQNKAASVPPCRNRLAGYFSANKSPSLRPRLPTGDVFDSPCALTPGRLISRTCRDSRVCTAEARVQPLQEPAVGDSVWKPRGENLDQTLGMCVCVCVSHPGQRVSPHHFHTGRGAMHD